MSSTLSRYAPLVLSLLRLMAGLLFLEHGMGKLLGFPVLTMDPPVGSLPWVAGFFEFGCGLLITIGLFTRAAAFLASGVMAFAYFLVHFQHGFFPANNGGDAAILFCFVFFYFVFAGGGSISVDAAMKKG
ncbi:DoxX family protein [Allorhizobium sp. BGMRC 0089]|uniref:DoxX family protein n=1 Tax=Allorhizobium sonneratiae TaxID=2934936 RepID=UPI002034989B|nr:DoxX family protein [Allorhizobium sonneratiae]MCM2294268.1 DoxX family protein [Allorhizobium sonneratiae]